MDKTDICTQRQEIIDFLIMCGEEDRRFLEISPSERTIEDYARLMVIARFLGYDKAFFRVFGEAAQCNADKEVAEYLESIQYDYQKVSSWIDAFVNGIKQPLYKQIVEKYWEEAKQIISKDNFVLNRFFKKIREV